MKTCAKCKVPKPLDEFIKDKTQKQGVRSYCKLCNREKGLEFSKKPESRSKRKQYNKITSKNISNYNKEYYQNNKEKVAVYKNKRYKTNIQHRLALVLRSRIKSALKKNVKNGKSLDLLGSSIDDYKLYLEKQFTPEMTWLNYGSYWEIDHIIPCDSFDLSSPIEQQKCFHYSNTQPLNIIENRQKKNKILND